MRLHKDAKAELIRSLPLFAGCTSSEVAEVAAIADEIDLAAGRQLATENAEGGEFVVIIEGTATVTKGDEVINTMGAGDFFGEIALVRGGPRTASVVAQTPVHALVISAHSFRTLIEHAPAIRAKVEGALAERTGDAGA
ncbi:MAG TPA: cyclic nucleotide-binding domain-containing protein [Marmoricola sp.]|jgi:CRP-like cAMP-binding protein|nr:cyclic nucleotide-binding domain-containing protein [Marmoricola sp.]